ncbi:serine/threonine-protein phosphatase [Streptomyces tricolor]|nr:serine/threonine-protein phosphatase [Streptomyces tricolor]
MQGHSAAAAALMGQVRTAVHAHATAGATPDQVLARTNRVLTDVEPDLLVSCLYAHLDLTGHQITLASAGHPPPLMRRPDGHTAPLTVDPGPLLGIHADAVYPPTTCAAARAHPPRPLHRRAGGSPRTGDRRHHRRPHRPPRPAPTYPISAG